MDKKEGNKWKSCRVIPVIPVQDVWERHVVRERERNTDSETDTGTHIIKYIYP